MTAAPLLAERHARQRAAEPLLPEVADFAAQFPAGDGVVATRGGEVVAYLSPTVGGERAEVGARRLRRLGARSAAGPLRRTSRRVADVAPGAASRPRTQSWSTPGSASHSGSSSCSAVRDRSPLEPRRFGGTIRPSTPDDLAGAAELRRAALGSAAGRRASRGWTSTPLRTSSRSGSDLWDDADSRTIAARRARRPRRRPRPPLPAARRATCACPSRTSTSRTPRRSPTRAAPARLALTAGALDWAREQGYPLVHDRLACRQPRGVALLAAPGWRPTFYRLARAVP